MFESVTRLLAKQLGTSAWGGPARRSATYWEERLRPALSAAQDSERAPDAALATPEAAGGDGWDLARGVAEIGPASATQAAQPAQQRLDGHGFFGSLRVLAQVRRMLLVCEGGDALYVIDQHAADERVRFDQLQRAHAAREVKMQQLLFPERVPCTEEEAALVDSQRDALLGLGLDCTLLGPTTVAVHAVPALLVRAAPERLLRDVLGELERAGGRAFSAAVDRVLATMACHGSIRAGDALSIEQAEALLRKLDAVSDFAGHCPHGRPVVHALPLDELERKLGR